MSLSYSAGTPQPEFQERGPYTLIGIGYQGGDTSALSALWDSLMNLTGKLAERSNILLGVGRPLDENRFEYFAGMVPRSLPATLPAGLEVRTLREARYAVFLHRGPLSRISQTYQYVYDEWFPRSGHEPGDYFLEVYDDRFIGPTAFNSIIEICVPLREN